MAEGEMNAKLREHLRRIKERLLRLDPGEGMLAELALIHERLERLELQQKALEVALGARDVLLRAQPAAKLPESAVVAADHLLDPEDGFYGLEHDAKGRPFRWTGPGTEFRFRLYVDRSAPRRLRASFLSAMDPTHFAAALCFVDGVRVEARYGPEDGHHAIRAELAPRAADGTGATLVAFTVPRVLSPRETSPGSTDERKLGLAFLRLEVAPVDAEPIQARPKALKAAAAGGKGD